MAKVTFEKPEEGTDMVFYEAMRLKAINKITPLACPNDKEAFVHIVIGTQGSLFKYQIIQACCPDMEELARNAIYPYLT